MCFQTLQQTQTRNCIYILQFNGGDKFDPNLSTQNLPCDTKQEALNERVKSDVQNVTKFVTPPSKIIFLVIVTGKMIVVNLGLTHFPEALNGSVLHAPLLQPNTAKWGKVYSVPHL